MVVFVLDKHKQVLMPCSEKRARLQLSRDRAVVHRMYPFTIRLKDRSAQHSFVQPLRLKLDPGSKTTGIAIIRELEIGKKEITGKSLENNTKTKTNTEIDVTTQTKQNPVTTATAIFLGQLEHKANIKDQLDSRRASRRSRRHRKTRYRPPRFLHRTRQKGWLPPSLEARVQQCKHLVHKLRQLCPITSLSTEHAKFDTQLLQNPNIKGVEYQQGTLQGYEVKEYLLETFKRTCAYCGGAGKDPILEIEHVVPNQPRTGPKGSNTISNLVIACQTCNTEKGNLQPQEWLTHLLKSKRKLDQIRAKKLSVVLKQLKKPLREAAFMNATRWKLYQTLIHTGLPVECGTGARTKMQRLQFGLPKQHYFDALCAGSSLPNQLQIKTSYIQIWSAIGRGRRQMARVNKYGFPVTHRKNQKQHFGFQTGDLVSANVLKGKYQGQWTGRVAVRSSGYFDLKDATGKRICQGISYKFCRMMQRHTGWQYSKEQLPAIPEQAFRN